MERAVRGGRRQIGLSVVIPTLDAAAALPATLAALASAPARGLRLDVVVADGGSSDDTVAVAERLGARVVAVPRGRGTQLAAGAAAAREEWLLFLHADTALGRGWDAAVAVFAAANRGRDRAAVFSFRLDDASAAARRVERWTMRRVRWLGLPYGDQGLLIHRDFYRELEGHRALPLMEDVDIIRRIGMARLELLDVPAVTSARRYRDGGWWLRPLRNLCCLALWMAGVPAALVARLYGR